MCETELARISHLTDSPIRITAPKNIEDLAREVKVKRVVLKHEDITFQQGYLVHPSGVAVRQDIVQYQARRAGLSEENLLALASATEGKPGTYSIAGSSRHYLARIKGNVQIEGVRYGVLTSARYV